MLALITGLNTSRLAKKEPPKLLSKVKYLTRNMGFR